MLTTAVREAINDYWLPISLICDFELGFSNAAKFVFGSTINIVYCFFHLKKSLSFEKRKIKYFLTNIKMYNF